MSNPLGDPGHGHSPAAWTAITIMLVGFSIGTAAFYFDVPWLVWASVGLILVGLVVGAAMKKAGYGVGGSKTTVKEH
ncbi:DUF6704 family protein [Microbacterium sp. P06]|uniref:DUF6704 family protein n=1 Tax=unclassified Microbacterium TaxID=2609290 RepID=UPI003745B08F